MTLKVKALNADCEAEVTHLCDLYKRSYGAQFRLTPVDDSRFWKSRVGNRFTTILVHADSKLIASVSLRADRENPAHIQLYLPVCDPAYLSVAANIRTAITDLMHRLSLRQKWEMLYSYQFLQIPEQAWFSHFLVDGVDVALWPSSLPSGSKHEKRNLDANADIGLGSVLISQRVLEIPLEQSDGKTVLFAPKRHVQFCRWIYESMGLSYTITDNLEEASKRAVEVHSEKAKKSIEQSLANSPLLALSADRRAIERHTHRQAGFSICFVEPSLTSGFRDLENILNRKARCADYVGLNMLDPKTPLFAEQLEKIGFGLGGVLPYHRNRHTLLYYKTVSDFQWKSIKQESPVFNYLKTNDASSLVLANQSMSRAKRTGATTTTNA